MKKVLLFTVTILTVLLASCSAGGYDQAKVDALDKENPDYKVMIEQAGYALDDFEKAKDPEKWLNDNEKELDALLSFYSAISICLEEDPAFPDELKDEADKLIKRVEKVFSKIRSRMNGPKKIETEEIVVDDYDEIVSAV